MFIDHKYIENLIEDTKNVTKEEIQAVLNKAETKRGLDHKEVAMLLNIEDKDQMNQLLNIAGKIKNEIYGNRVVMFAPLYISDYCVNNCKYCGYKRDNGFARRKLTQSEIREEVKLLEKMGHKRLALEAGEDPVNCTIDYVLESIQTIYDTHLENGSIRRINVNIAATTVENYKKLKDAEIGTYILFQETYHQPTYELEHPKSIKGDYEYHLTAFDRAMEAGLGDVGGGVLFGLANYKFEVLGLMLHNQHLEEQYGVGFHTISVPRMKRANGMELSEYPNIVTDEEFIKLVAVIRLAVPYTGIILSTRENGDMRKFLLKYGVSQVSAGSSADVGGYSKGEESTTQFFLEDHRPASDVLKSLFEDGYIPSYCTACYRSGRIGDRFMQLAKSGAIHNVCTPNALMTFAEYLFDYADEDMRTSGLEFISREIEKISHDKVRVLVSENIKKIQHGERDLFL